MSLREFQSALRHLYLDSAFRGKFFSSSRGSPRGFKLNDAEARALRGINRAQLEDFCRGLENKNSARLQAAFQHTSKILGARFWDLYREFIFRHSELREWPDRLESFATLLFHALSADSGCARWLCDLAQFEYARAMLNHWARGGLSPSALKRLSLSRCSRKALPDQARKLAFGICLKGHYSYDVLALTKHGKARFKSAPREKPVSVLFYRQAKYRPVEAIYL